MPVTRQTMTPCHRVEIGTVSQNSSTVSQLPDLLNWSGSIEQGIAIFKDYKRRLFFAWGNSLIQILRSNSVLGRPLAVKARALPQDAFHRFLTAPVVVDCLEEVVDGECTAEKMSLLGDALDAEYYRLSDRKREHGRTVWTALGDYRSSEDGADYQAPLVAGIIPLDCRSPLAQGEELNRFYGPFVDFTSLETQKILNGLNEAVAGISQSSHQVTDFIRLFTRVIIVRKNENSPHQVGSRSFSRYIGATIIENPLASATDAVALADSLLHEAIHHLLYSEELQRPFVSRLDLAKSFTVVSPWTGREINLRQYLHACFVWFGLWRFWNLCSDSAVFPEARVRGNAQRAARGFGSTPVLDRISQVLRFVSPDLQSSISRMQTVVLEEVA